MSRRLDLIGKRFYRWIVTCYSHTESGRAYWLCRCDCGTEKPVYGMSLTRGVSTSCGCWRVEVGIANGRATRGSQGNGGITRRHGEAAARTVEYRTWVSMHERCRSPASQKWKNYGGRGIRVCERWSSFEHFLVDMGRRPSKTHSLDRKEVNGDYSKENCRWATNKEQVDNRRKFGRIERFDDIELLREIANRQLPLLSIDGYLSFSS